MHINRGYLFLFAILMNAGTLLSQQNVEFKKTNFKDDKEGFNKAMDQLLDGEDYYEQGGSYYTMALENFLKANEFNPNNADLNYKIGVCYYLSSVEKVKSIEYYKKAYLLDNNVSEDIHYMMGLGYQLNYEFDSAIKEFNIYRESLDTEILTNWEKKINKSIEECKNGKELIKEQRRVLIDNIGKEINSSYIDHSPLISADESMMIFTSRRENTTGREKDAYDNIFFEDIYVSHNIDGKWTDAENIGSPLNTKDHDATVGLSPDGQELFIYNGLENGGDIFACKLRGDKWSAPKALPKTINTPYQETSASFSYDGKYIYFISNRIKNNLGGRDIYYSKRDDKGNWEEAVNIGNTINTPYDEDCVFMHPDGRTLYFSSKGHKTMGGFDIFKSVMDEEGKWSEPENIGYPINTPDNDAFFVMAASGKSGYYSSIRKECIGQSDIYKITFLEEDTNKVEKIEKDQVRLTLLKGVILDPETGLPLEAKIEITDNDKNEIVATFTSNSKTGKYLISLPSGKNYGIAVTANGYLFHSENFDIPEVETFKEIKLDVKLNKVKEGAKIVLRNIFFDHAKATLRTSSLAELTRINDLLYDYPEMRIEISGHTDNTGSLTTNQKLSEARAKSVVDYLIEQGVDTDRLEYKGYNFKFPVASNDTEEGRQLNRRVEFKILSE